MPGLPSRRPSGSFKIPGANALSVDLLVPGKTLGNTVPLPELGTHAQQVPLLDYLVGEPIDAIVLGPNHVVPVRVPAPERFVLHNLISSQERRTDRAKARKDLEQAAALAAALAEDRPDALADAFRDLPASARSSARRGAHAAAGQLEKTHPPGHQSLSDIARRR